MSIDAPPPVQYEPLEPLPEPPVAPAATADDEPTGIGGLLGLLGLVALLGFTAGWGWLLIIGGLLFMVFMHELGHYATAKASGMKVTQFFIGFGPRLWSMRRGETEYGFKAIPAGAFVRIIGMNNLDPVESGDESRAFRQQPYWQRLMVLVAGSAMHFVIALLCLFALFFHYGFHGVEGPSDEQWNVGRVVQDSAAESMGILDDDKIVALNGQPVATFFDVRDIVTVRPGQAVEVEVVRDGERLTLAGEIGVNGDDPSVGLLGVGLGYEEPAPRGFAASVGKSFTEFGSTIKLSTTALVDFFSPSSLGNFFGQVAGNEPEPIVTASGDSTPAPEGSGRILSIYGAARLGNELVGSIPDLLILYLSINIFIGVFNLVPLLPLDGGHVAIATYERLRSRPGRRHMADVTRLLPLTYAVVMVLALVGIAALYLDIADPVSIN